MRQKDYSCGLEAALDVGRWKMEGADPVGIAIGGAPIWRIAPFGAGNQREDADTASQGNEADGIVKRRDFKEVPPRVDYALTSFGQSLHTALAPLCDWGTLHMKRIGARKEATEAKTRALA